MIVCCQNTFIHTWVQSLYVLADEETEHSKAHHSEELQQESGKAGKKKKDKKEKKSKAKEKKEKDKKGKEILFIFLTNM